MESLHCFSYLGAECIYFTSMLKVCFSFWSIVNLVFSWQCSCFFVSLLSLKIFFLPPITYCFLPYLCIFFSFANFMIHFFPQNFMQDDDIQLETTRARCKFIISLSVSFIFSWIYTFLFFSWQLQVCLKGMENWLSVFLGTKILEVHLVFFEVQYTLGKLSLHFLELHIVVYRNMFAL